MLLHSGGNEGTERRRGYRRAAETASTCQGTSPLMLSVPPTTRVPVLTIGVIFVVAAVVVSVVLSSTSSGASSLSSAVMFQCSKVFMARVSLLFASGAVILPQGYGTGGGTVTVRTGCVLREEANAASSQHPVWGLTQETRGHGPAGCSPCRCLCRRAAVQVIYKKGKSRTCFWASETTSEQLLRRRRPVRDASVWREGAAVPLLGGRVATAGSRALG